ncbi:MAG: DUF4157 domain-containing protein [Anaerolineales bacterium]
MSEFARNQNRTVDNSLLRPAQPERTAVEPAHELNPQPFGNHAAQKFAGSCPRALPSPGLCPFGGACHACPARAQAKLTVSQPDDPYEQEADRVADQVMAMPEPKVQRACPSCEEDTLQKKPLADQITPLVQRQEEPEEEEEPVQAKPAPEAVQRQEKPGEEEEEPVQAKAVDEPRIQRQAEPEDEEEPVQTKPDGGHSPAAKQSAPSIVHEALKSSGRPLDPDTRAFMEPRFGRDFGGVKVHTDTDAALSAGKVHALAYTVGQDLVFSAGQYAPGSGMGRRLIAHELSHVVQQQPFPTGMIPPRTGQMEKTHEGHMLQRAGPVAIAGAAAAGFVAGFGIAFGIDYLSMTHARAERYARSLNTRYPGWLEALPNCPCNAPTHDTTNWVRDSNPDLQTYHPGAASSFRSTSAATGGSRHGQQCTYDAADRLITDGPGAGTPDVYSPSGRLGALNIPYHVVYDVKTWKELGWSTYNQYWRPNNGLGCPSNSGSQPAP